MRLAGWKSRQMLGRYGASAADQRAREAHRHHGLGDRLSTTTSPCGLLVATSPTTCETWPMRSNGSASTSAGPRRQSTAVSPACPARSPTATTRRRTWRPASTPSATEQPDSPPMCAQSPPVPPSHTQPSVPQRPAQHAHRPTALGGAVTPAACELRRDPSPLGRVNWHEGWGRLGVLPPRSDGRPPGRT